MIEIKKATLKDIPLIIKLANIAFTDTYKDIITPNQLEYMLDWMYSPHSLENQFKSGHVYYIGFKNGNPFGYTSINQEQEDSFCLEKIYLLSEYKGQKLGKALFEKAISHIKEIHPTPCKMTLHVNRENNAVQFYKYMGMYELYAKDFDIGNGFYMNDYIMALDLGSSEN